MKYDIKYKAWRWILTGLVALALLEAVTSCRNYQFKQGQYEAHGIIYTRSYDYNTDIMEINTGSIMLGNSYVNLDGDVFYARWKRCSQEVCHWTSDSLYIEYHYGITQPMVVVSFKEKKPIVYYRLTEIYRDPR